MARRQRHLIQLADVPGGNDDAARIRILLQLLEHVAQLIDLTAVRCAPGTPLFAVHRAEIAVFIGPLIPNGDLVVTQVGDIGIAVQEP